MFVGSNLILRVHKADLCVFLVLFTLKKALLDRQRAPSCSRMCHSARGWSDCCCKHRPRVPHRPDYRFCRQSIVLVRSKEGPDRVSCLGRFGSTGPVREPSRWGLCQTYMQTLRAAIHWSTKIIQYTIVLYVYEFVLGWCFKQIRWKKYPLSH